MNKNKNLFWNPFQGFWTLGSQFEHAELLKFLKNSYSTTYWDFNWLIKSQIGYNLNESRQSSETETNCDLKKPLSNTIFKKSQPLNANSKFWDKYYKILGKINLFEIKFFFEFESIYL